MIFEELENKINKYGWKFSGKVNCVDPPALLFENERHLNFYITVWEDIKENKVKNIAICDWRNKLDPVVYYDSENLSLNKILYKILEDFKKIEINN